MKVTALTARKHVVTPPWTYVLERADRARREKGSILSFSPPTNSGNTVKPTWQKANKYETKRCVHVAFTSTQALTVTLQPVQSQLIAARREQALTVQSLDTPYAFNAFFLHSKHY